MASWYVVLSMRIIGCGCQWVTCRLTWGGCLAAFVWRKQAWTGWRNWDGLTMSRFTVKLPLLLWSIIIRHNPHRKTCRFAYLAGLGPDAAFQASFLNVSNLFSNKNCTFHLRIWDLHKAEVVQSLVDFLDRQSMNIIRLLRLPIGEYRYNKLRYCSCFDETKQTARF